MYIKKEQLKNKQVYESTISPLKNKVYMKVTFQLFIIVSYNLKSFKISGLLLYLKILKIFIQTADTKNLISFNILHKVKINKLLK